MKDLGSTPSLQNHPVSAWDFSHSQKTRLSRLNSLQISPVTVTDVCGPSNGPAYGCMVYLWSTSSFHKLLSMQEVEFPCQSKRPGVQSHYNLPMSCSTLSAGSPDRTSTSLSSTVARPASRSSLSLKPHVLNSAPHTETAHRTIANVKRGENEEEMGPCASAALGPFWGGKNKMNLRGRFAPKTIMKTGWTFSELTVSTQGSNLEWVKPWDAIICPGAQVRFALSQFVRSEFQEFLNQIVRLCSLIPVFFIMMDLFHKAAHV